MIHIRYSNKDNLIIFMNTMGITSYMIASRAYSQHGVRAWCASRVWLGGSGSGWELGLAVVGLA